MFGNPYGSVTRRPRRMLEALGYGEAPGGAPVPRTPGQFVESMTQGYQPHGQGAPQVNMPWTPGEGARPGAVPQGGVGWVGPVGRVGQVRPGNPAPAGNPEVGAMNPYAAQAPALAAAPAAAAGAGNMPASPPALPGESPDHAPQHFTGDFKGSGEGYLTRLLRQLYGNSGDMQGALRNLEYEAQADPSSAVTLRHAGEFENANRYYDQASQRLQQMLADRGMTDSTAFGTGVGALEGERARGLAGISRDIYSEADARKLQAEQQLRSLLMALQGQGVDIATGKANRRLQKWLQEQRQELGWGDLLKAWSQNAGRAASLAANTGE